MSSLDILAGRLPDGTVSTDRPTRRQCAIDSWSLALLRRVRGDDLPEPAAVVFPAGTEEVATVLAWASQTGTAVIPRGAGSGVCGGAQAETQAIVLDLSRMDRIGPIDAVMSVGCVVFSKPAIASQFFWINSGVNCRPRRNVFPSARSHRSFA